MLTAHIKPAKGRLVRDPDTAIPLPAEGLTVSMSTFWVRRLRDGDVVKVSTSKSTKRSSKES